MKQHDWVEFENVVMSCMRKAREGSFGNPESQMCEWSIAECQWMQASTTAVNRILFERKNFEAIVPETVRIAMEEME